MIKIDKQDNGNGKKCPKEDVLEYLADKQWHTTADMAEHFGVSLPTVGNRIKELVSDGFGILAGMEGYRLMEKEDIRGEEEVIAIEHMLQRMINIVMRQALVARPMKRLAAEARKLLPKSPEERGIVRKYLVQLTHLIDFQEIEEM